VTDLVERIKSRGYWHVLVRPKSFVERRVDRLGQLEAAMEQAHVQLRGWDYPHVGRGRDVDIERGGDWVGQDTDWEHKLEVWRLYLSGQFVHYFAISYDWRDRSALWPPDSNWARGARLHISEAVGSVTEMLVFASRLAATDVGDEQMDVAIRLHGLRGRRLEADPTWLDLSFPERKADVDDFHWKRSLSRTELVAKHREIAVDVTAGLFELFHWDVGADIVRREQDSAVGRST
jgi:hypothetical protein